MMRGITRSLVLGLASEEGLPVREVDFTVANVYGADEAFVTGGRREGSRKGAGRGFVCPSTLGSAPEEALNPS
jgi:branched-subunit amino acid aminotransferase/4-amino-4-deoxychorismate lyase